VLEAPVVPGVPVGGANVAVAPVGKPEAASVTGEVKGSVVETLARLMVYCAAAPPKTLALGGVAAMVKSGSVIAGVPEPESKPTCGEFAALSVTVTFAVTVVVDAGVKLTLMVQ
jgi:hypothetical protein